MQHKKHIDWKFMLKWVTVGNVRWPRNSSEVGAKKYFWPCITTKQRVEVDVTVI